MKSRFVMGGLPAAMVLLFCVGCDEHATIGVRIVSGPTHVAVGNPATFVVKLTYSGFFYSPTSRIRVEWGDKMIETSGPVSVGDSVLFKHGWLKSGNYQVTAVALAYPQPRSYPWAVRVSSASDPVIDSAQFNYLWRPIELVVYAHDPAVESLRLHLAWSDGHNETTGFQASPCRLSVPHHFGNPDHCGVVFEVLNKSGDVTAQETLSGSATSTGEVSYMWLGAHEGSPAIVDSVVYVVGPDGFYGLRGSGTPYSCPGAFAGHPSFCSQTGHVFVGSEDGCLHAFTPALSQVWEFPAHESITGWEWGPAAVNGNALYVPCSNDSIYCFLDNDTSVVRAAAFSAAQVDAVVLDSAGSVYVGSDNGYLFKLIPGLNLVWGAQLQAGGRIFAPVIGADGTIYCTSATNEAYAVNAADGSVKWTAPLVGICYRPVVGSDGLYAATTACYLYKLDLATGAALWWTQLGNERLNAAPILVTGGYAYVQTEDDRLYCVSHSTGDSVWVCNTSECLPHQPRIAARRFVDGVSSPAVDANGRVYMVGSEVLFKLSTYAPLDASSPWPKWQHDLHNTGYVDGGR